MSSTPNHAAMPSAEVNGITISYSLSGPPAGTWLVLINGLADTKESWSYQLPAFTSANYRVLTYDNRGIGSSSAPPGPYTSSQMASDLHALLLHLDVQKFHLLGVSMGGMVAQSYAINYPNGSPEAQGRAMLSLSLCCTYSQPTPFCSRMFSLWADMATRMSVQDVMRDVTLWAFTVPFFRTRMKELEEVEEAMRGLDMSLEAYLAQLNVIREFDSTGKLGGLEGLEGGRVMVLAGKEDILIPVQLSVELAGGVQGSVWKTCQGGHGCMWEFPDDFNETVLDFLESLG